VREGSTVPPLLFNIIMNNVCSKIKEEMKVTDLKAFIYADNIMILGDSMKELRIRFLWESENKNYSLQINLEKTVVLTLSRKEGKSTIMKIIRSKIKQVDRWPTW
jgi:hypothetical protein